MKKVLLTTTAIVGLTAPAFAADPTAVSDQPYFHHSHPMSWSGSMSISLTNPSGSDVDAAIVKSGKRDWVFDQLNAAHASGEENATGLVAGTSAQGNDVSLGHHEASEQLSAMAAAINTHDSYTIGGTAGGAGTANVSAVEDVIDDFLGGSHSAAMDVITERFFSGAAQTGSDAADFAADLATFAAAQDAGTESVEKNCFY
jgi:hypothetical protein